jgi:hypothetical protein
MHTKSTSRWRPHLAVIFPYFRNFYFSEFSWNENEKKKMKNFGASFNFFSAENFIEDLSKNNGDNSVEETLGMRATSSVVGAPSRIERVHRTKKKMTR